MIHNRHQTSFLEKIEFPFVLKRAKNMITNMAFGGLGGYVVYLLTPEFKRPFSFTGIENKSPLPVILTGILSVAAIEMIGLTFDIGIRLLGDRKFYEKLSFPEIATPLDRFRQHAWHIVTQFEKLQVKTDALISHILKIRSSGEIKVGKIPLHELHFIELVRHAFQEQTLETINEPFPVKGYTVMLWTFTKGFIDKINQLYEDIHLEKIAQLKKRKELDEILC
jgi:hypothetical protein